jgi:hypothetical protein
LTLESLNASDEFGIGHLPLAHDTFRAWEPLLLRVHTVSDRELEGYHIWLEEHGGLFR